MSWSTRLHHHLFADNTQIYCSGWLDNVPAAVSWLESCIIIVDIYAVAWCDAKTFTESQLRQLPPSHHPRQPVRRQASDCRPRPGRVVRRRAIKFLRDVDKSLQFNLLKSELRSSNPFQNAGVPNEGGAAKQSNLAPKLVAMATSFERSNTN